MMRVLVVDDCEQHVAEMTTALRMYQMEAKGASNGPDALAVAREWSPHLIVYDGLLEGMNAWQFGQELLRPPDGWLPGDESPRKPYMVALTGFGTTRLKALVREFGFDEYVEKPIKLNLMLGWVKHAKERSKAGV